jgi:uncharacterized membrane protein
MGEEIRVREDKTKKKVVAICLLFTLLSTGIVIHQVLYGPKQITITAKEPILITPESISLNLYPGENKTVNFYIKNYANATIPLQSTVTVASVPPGGNPNDVILNYQSTPLIPPLANYTYTIKIQLKTSAINGTYTIKVQFIRT